LQGIWNLAAWKAGLFEVQDEGSQLIALSTEAFPGEVMILPEFAKSDAQ